MDVGRIMLIGFVCYCVARGYAQLTDLLVNSWWAWCLLSAGIFFWGIIVIEAKKLFDNEIPLGEGFWACVAFVSAFVLPVLMTWASDHGRGSEWMNVLYRFRFATTALCVITLTLMIWIVRKFQNWPRPKTRVGDRVWGLRAGLIKLTNFFYFN